MPVAIVLNCRYPLGPGCLPVQATSWALQLVLLTRQPSHWHCQRRVWAGASTDQGHPLASPHLRTLLLVGPVQVGAQGPPLQAATSLYSPEPRSHLPHWAVTSLWS